MTGWMKNFENMPDFGMEYLMRIPDQCIYFLMLMFCLIVILSIHQDEAGEEDVWG